MKNIKRIQKDNFGFSSMSGHFVVGSNALKISDSEYSSDCEVIDISSHILNNNSKILELNTKKAPHKNSKIQLLGLFAICSVVLGAFIGYVADLNRYEITQYKVQAGETLWEIALGSNYSNDVTETIREIKNINHLENEIIRPGQTILVPYN